MGVLLVLREPQVPARAKRLTRAQRRRREADDARWWAEAEAAGRVVDVDVDVWLGLVDEVGEGRLQLFGQVSPWADTVLDPADLSRLETDLRLFTETGAHAQVIAEIRALADQWRAHPELALHVIGD